MTPSESAGRAVAEPGDKWHRWFAPAIPLDAPDVPRGYFVTATKR